LVSWLIFEALTKRVRPGDIHLLFVASSSHVVAAYFTRGKPIDLGQDFSAIGFGLRSPGEDACLRKIQRFIGRLIMTNVIVFCGGVRTPT